MTIANKILVYFAVLTTLLVCLAGALWLMYRNAQVLADQQERRFYSYQLAEQLRHSSDDLTRMARTYAFTGDLRYKRYFDTIVAIRDGLETRPGNYSEVFWDFVTNDPAYPLEKGKKISIVAMMNQLQFSQEEFNYLYEAKKLSDKLTEIEKQAFNAMEGLFKDNQGKYTRRGEPNPTLAQKLLHSPTYHQEKAKIMGKILEFQKHLAARTKSEVEHRQKDQQALLISVGLFSFLLIGVSLFGYLYFKKGIIVRLNCIQGWITQMKQSEYDLRPTMDRKDEIGVIADSFVQMAQRVASQVDLLEKSSVTDPLTGLNNRKGLNEQLDIQEYNYNRYGTDCAVIMMDIDYFKQINDNQGHLVGDRVLTETAKLLRQKMRKSDVIGRWGGDEFLIICPNTNLIGARILAESTRKSMREHEFSAAVGHRTASFGVCAFGEGLSADDVVNGADRALYQAKTGGRDQVC